MIEHYITLRQLHVGFVTASGSLFALRAFAALAGARWPLSRPVRVASWVIDTGLLSAGALLWATLQLNPLVQAWLGAKLLLLLVYIGLGTMALRRARTPLGAPSLDAGRAGLLRMDRRHGHRARPVWAAALDVDLMCEVCGPSCEEALQAARFVQPAPRRPPLTDINAGRSPRTDSGQVAERNRPPSQAKGPDHAIQHSPDGGRCRRDVLHGRHGTCPAQGGSRQAGIREQVRGVPRRRRQGQRALCRSTQEPPARPDAAGAPATGAHFLAARIYEVIEGAGKGHGTRAMPVWGVEYTVQAAEALPDLPYNQAVFVRTRITALLEYINQLQVK
ncbi:MAG: SirB2 family protein [Burkholderiaceae bacterium]